MTPEEEKALKIKRDFCDKRKGCIGCPKEKEYDGKCYIQAYAPWIWLWGIDDWIKEDDDGN